MVWFQEKNMGFETKETIYDWERMKTYVKTSAKHLKLYNSLKALDYAVDAHMGQHRKRSDVPYIYHPLNLACHALAMNIEEDEIVAGCLLHDVIEECGKTDDELPVNDETKNLVNLLTHEKTTDENREQILKEYYKNIARNPKASLIKCIDRCNNLTTMTWGLSSDKINRMIMETEEYYPTLLKVIKATPEYNNAAWLLHYQMDSMLDIYKRLM